MTLRNRNLGLGADAMFNPNRVLYRDPMQIESEREAEAARLLEQSSRLGGEAVAPPAVAQQGNGYDGLVGADKFKRWVNPELFDSEREYAAAQGDSYEELSAGDKFKRWVNPQLFDEARDFRDEDAAALAAIEAEKAATQDADQPATNAMEAQADADDELPDLDFFDDPMTESQRRGVPLPDMINSSGTANLDLTQPLPEGMDRPPGSPQGRGRDFGPVPRLKRRDNSASSFWRQGFGS